MSSFAAMNPSELLKETEKAVGTDNMLEHHEALIKYRKDEKELERVWLP